jgi:hypothetical protein
VVAQCGGDVLTQSTSGVVAHLDGDMLTQPTGGVGSSFRWGCDGSVYVDVCM